MLSLELKAPCKPSVFIPPAHTFSTQGVILGQAPPSTLLTSLSDYPAFLTTLAALCTLPAC